MENRPIRQQNRAELDYCRRRERECAYNEKWDGAVKYYDTVEKNNIRFENWTSPRYYEVNNELMSKTRKERDKTELLEKRRERLKKLFMEDEASYGVEQVLSARDRYIEKKSPRNKFDDIPTELLKDINNECKITEATRRKREAEQNLYAHWRGNHPVLRECQTRKNAKDLKLSWLDQQIEKRMAKDREEEQTRKSIKERDLYIKEQEIKEAELKLEMDAKNLKLREDLDIQVEEFYERQRIAEQLKANERVELEKQDALDVFLEKQRLDDIKRKERALALYNLKQYKMKLKQKAADVQANLDFERCFVQDLINSEIAEQIHNAQKKHEIKLALDEFLQLTIDLKEIEERRKKYLSFMFDSEAKQMYENQERIWLKEQKMRSALISDFLRELKTQIDLNVFRNMEEQKMLLLEREERLKRLEDSNEEMQRLKEFEAAKKDELRRDLDEQVKENRVSKKKLETLQRKYVCDELDQIKDEEARLKHEIMLIQKGKNVHSYGRNRFFY